MNLPTIITILILLAVAGLVVGLMIYAKKHGKSSCGCDCANCPMHGNCQKTEKK